MTLKNQVQKLLSRSIFEMPPHQDTLFDDAIKECVRLLEIGFPWYAEFLKSRSNESLPALFLPILKEMNFDSGKTDNSTFIQSSGTSGRPVRIPLDAFSLNNRVQLMKRVYEAMGFEDNFEHAFCFILDPQSSSMAGSIITTQTLKTFARLKGLQHMAKLGPSGFELNQIALSALFQSEWSAPVLILGYPALIAQCIQGSIKQGLKRKPLPVGSAILTGGGWKNFLQGVNVEPNSFRSLASDFFDIPVSHIRDMYGLTESPVVFVECEKHHFHIPSFCRVDAVNPLQQTPLSEGEQGLLRITHPFSTSFPLASVLTTDKISIHRDCPCGRPARYFVPHGRARSASFETCAMAIGRQLT
jgi:phenylacetate-coenzyme A ligase PaaK-like adenylate-forming protein